MTKINVKLDINTSEFQQYIKDINEKYWAEVGILGGENSDEGVTIAEYGRAHEYGVIERNLPRRSFIKDPLERHLGDEVRRVKNTLTKLLSAKDIEGAVAILGKKGEEIVKKAFKTSGDGTWKDLAESTKAAMSEKRRKGYTILVDTGDLVGSITSKVEKQ